MPYFTWDQQYERGKWYTGGTVKAAVSPTRREDRFQRPNEAGYATVRAIEHPMDATYPSILGEWGLVADGPLEWRSAASGGVAERPGAALPDAPDRADEAVLLGGRQHVTLHLGVRCDFIHNLFCERDAPPKSSSSLRGSCELVLLARQDRPA